MTDGTLPLHYHLQQLADGQWVIIDDDTGKVLTTDPYGGGVTGESPTPPSDLPTLGPNPAAPGGASSGTPPMPDWQQFLIWTGALVVLWFILTALDEAGYPGVARGLAALILGGALLFMLPDRNGRPGAISNMQALTQPRKQG